MSKTEVKVVAAAELDEGSKNELTNDDSLWALRFYVKIGEIRFVFIVTEPYLLTCDAWMDLARGKSSACLYQGNGEGSIDVKNGNYKFTAWPSGAGGDVISCFSLPIGAVSKPLMAEIKKARARGWRFKSV
jgi:hypothetical protein